jgi:LPS-assembly lipoprotein
MRSSASGLRALSAAIVLTAGMALSACTATPLYGENATGASVRSDLAAISVLPPIDRVGQLVRNELIFAFNGGSPPVAALYELSLNVATTGGGLNLAAPTELSAGLTVTVRHMLVEIASGATLSTGVLSVDTRYLRSNSAFANVRAEQDAEQRAATEAARQLALDIAAALAARPARAPG